MSFYKKIFKNKKIVQGSKGAKPSYLMPPDGTNTKIGFQVYEALDLLCEGPIAGLVDQKGLFVEGLRAKKEFDSNNNKIGSSTNGIDKAVYFDEEPLRTEINEPSIGKYDVSLRLGEEFQNPPDILSQPKKLIQVGVPIQGPYNMAGAENGARTGSGSRDVRREGTSARDFVNWQRFVPRQKLEEPYVYSNYDRNVTKLNIGLQIDALSDTKSFATAGENESGRSKMGTPLSLTVTFEVSVGKVDQNGIETSQLASFTTRGGKGVTLGQSNGRLSVTGVITAPYVISLELLNLPTITSSDLYSFCKIRKIEHETISNLVKRDCGVATVTEINEETYLYPNSVTVGSSIDSRYYPSAPARTFRAKGKKILIPSNYTPINADGSDRRFSDDGSTRGNTIYDGEWDGTFKFGWSDNPAWIYYDLLINTRYGLGSYLRDVDIIDKWSLYEIGQYCDAVTLNDGGRGYNASGVGKFIGLDDGLGGLEPRFSCNILIKDQANAIEALKDLGRSFRAMTYYSDSCVSVKVDRPYFFEDFNRTSDFEDVIGDEIPNPPGDYINPPKELKFPPHLYFNNLNVKDGIFNYSDVDRTTKLSAVEVSYIDKKTNFRPKYEYVEDTDAIKKVGLNVKSMEAIGCTSRAQANRLANYVLFESIHTTETVSFSAGLEALMIQPGDIIQVDDEIRNFSKNFGTVLGASGSVVYSDPDSTGTSRATGLGPEALFVQPAVGSDQLDYVTGGTISIYNPIGKSGIQEFYRNPSSSNSLYREIHNPQIIQLDLKEGGSGLTYKYLDESLAFYIENLKLFQKTQYAVETSPSQWFSEKDANIIPGSVYSIDASGRENKFYRVISISENQENSYDVTATIHHTGKFKFVEEGVAFDKDPDTFQPDLLLTAVTRPNAPSSVTTGAFSQNADGSLNLPISITKDASRPGDRYVVFLEEPNTNVIQSEVNRSASDPTNFTLQGNNKIDQIGDYQINVFSESLSPTIVRSSSGKLVTFTTSGEDFNLAATDNFFDYSNISFETDFDSSFDVIAKTGSGTNSFVDNNSGLNATFKLQFEDVFENSGNSVLQSITGQQINLFNVEGTLLKRGFKTLTNETELEIGNSDLNSGFGYTGDGRYRMSPQINFEVAKFTLTGSVDEQQFVAFEQNFSIAPKVFTSFVFEGDVNQIDQSKPIGRISATTTGFFVTGSNINNQKFVYVASESGVKKFDFSSKKIIIGNTIKGQAGFKRVVFPESFNSVPSVLIQLQQAESSPLSFSDTIVTGITTTGFFFESVLGDDAFDDGTGSYSYLAVENNLFNLLESSSLPKNTLNYGSSGAENFNITGDFILEEVNKNTNSSSRYNHDQYAIFAQKSGDNRFFQDKSLGILRTGNKNSIFSYFLNTGTLSGINSSSDDGSLNHISVTGTGSNLVETDLSDFTLAAWVKFETGLTGQQALFESVSTGENGLNTGVAWFQSGDGFNYLNLNGTEFKSINKNINDEKLHLLQVSVDRDANIKGFLDGTLNHTNTGITSLSSTSFKSETGVKILGSAAVSNGGLGLSALNQGSLHRYFVYVNERIETNYFNDPDLFTGTYFNDPNTQFILDLNNKNELIDVSSRSTGELVGSNIQQGLFLRQDQSTNLNLLQIGVTGTI